MDYNCYVVDDEADSIEILEDYIADTPNLCHIFSTTNPKELFPMVLQHDKPKITFLDIEMPGMTGMDLADLISPHAAIIFITSHLNYAPIAFEKNAYDYLIKPFSYTRFLQAVLKVEGRMQSCLLKHGEEETYFYIRGNKQGELIKIYFNEVVYVESLMNYIRIFTTATNYVTYLTLKEITQKLNRGNFIRIHKSYLVNIDRIQRFFANDIYLENNVTLPVGPLYYPDLALRLKNRIFSRNRKSQG